MRSVIDGAAAPTRYGSLMPKRALFGWRCSTAPATVTAWPRRRSRILTSARRPMRLSRRWRAKRPEELIRAAFPVSSRTGRWSESTAGVKRACSPRTGRWKSPAGDFRSSLSSISGGRVVTWADAKTQPFLVGGYLPLPGVRWIDPQWELRVTAFASGERARSRLVARYELINRTADRLTLTLALAVRPFQVNPPTQFLNTVGGVSPIDDLAWDGAALQLTGCSRCSRCNLPIDSGRFRLARARCLRFSPANGRTRMPCATNPGSPPPCSPTAFTLAPHAHVAYRHCRPALRSSDGASASGQIVCHSWLEQEQRAVAATWRQKLNRVRFRVPPGDATA